MSRNYWIRRGIFLVAMLSVGAVLWWRDRPGTALPEIKMCEAELERVYEAATAAALAQKVIPATLDAVPERMIYLGYDGGAVAPLVVEEFGHHPEVEGRRPVCCLLSNGKVMLWRSQAADYPGLAAELAALYPNSGSQWRQVLSAHGR